MERYDLNAKLAVKLILNFILKRMEDKNITIDNLSFMTNIKPSILLAYLSTSEKIPLLDYLKICGSLKLQPYLIASEHVKTDFTAADLN